MEQDREEILNKKQSEKMCSLCGDGAGEMCSPADTDTCGVRSLDVKSTEVNTEKGLKARHFRELRVRFSSAFLNSK